MQDMPLIGPRAGELVPFLICMALIIIWVRWPQIAPHLRGFWPTRRRVARGRARSRKAAQTQRATTEPADLSARPASLARRRDLRPQPRQPKPTGGAQRGKVAPVVAQEAQPTDPAPTRAAVAGLPASVPWPLDQAQLNRLPVLFDGERWLTLDATASRHGVICGASRSGKGNLLQLMALTVLTKGPERAEVWVLDPKGGLDYQPLRHLAHARVFADVVAGENPFDGDLSAGYQAALDELGRRNQLLLAAEARNHHEYRERTGKTLPILVLICDEVAELSGPQQRVLATLARMSAAAGMVIWAATQYPTVESLPAQVQANALDRIVFQFPSPRYTTVALGLAPGERPKWEPSAIGERGVAILRQDGRDVAIGRVHHLTEPTYRAILRALRSRYPRVTEQQDAVTVERAGAVPAPVTPAVTQPQGPETGGMGVSAPVAVTPIDPERERDELVRELARDPQMGVRKIRQRLAERGMSIAQDKLTALIREVRGSQTAPADDTPAESEAPQTSTSDAPLGQATLAAAA